VYGEGHPAVYQTVMVFTSLRGYADFAAEFLKGGPNLF